MRALKILGIVLCGVIALVIVVLGIVWLTVNPNDYKGRIAGAVKASTGRELALPGDIKLSVFPWIVLELGPASLGNPPGYGNEPFASIRHAALRVKLLPLLRRELQVGRIEIDGLDLRLQRDSQGRGNWQGFGASTAPTASQSRLLAGGRLSELAGIAINDGRLSYGDFEAEHANLDVGPVAIGVAVPVALKLNMISSRGARPLALAGKFKLTIVDSTMMRYHIGSMELGGTLPPRASSPAASWSLSLPEGSLDFQSKTASVPNYTLQLAAARVSGSLQASDVVDALHVTGAFRLEPLSPRELLRQLGSAAPETRDAKALTRLAGDGAFAYGANALSLTGLRLQLDDSHMQGRAAVTDLATKAMSFALSLDRIDIDRYLSPVTASKAPSPPKGSPARPSGSTGGLKTLRLDGALTIDNVTMAGLTARQVRARLVAKDGIIHIAPATAALYGGSYAGDITLDARTATPSARLNQTLTDVDVAQLLKAFAKTERVSGRGKVTSSLTARGSTSKELLASLNGHVAGALTNGAIQGADLWFEINRASTLLQQRTLTAGTGTGRTQFDTFKASADLVNGIATTKDLTITSQNLRVTGQGTANLATRAINYQLLVSVPKSASTANNAVGGTLLDVPVNVTGTMTDFKVRPDAQALAKARLQQELKSRKGELQQKLGDTLKGLLQGRPRR